MALTYLVDSANYHVSLLAAANLVVTLVLVLLGLTVLIRERISLVSVLFFLVTSTVSVWLFAFAWMYASTDAVVAVWWAKAAYLGVPFISTAIYHFTVVALRVYRANKVRVWTGWAISALFMFVILSSDALVSDLYHYSWGYYPKYGPLGLPFATFHGCLILASLYHYWMEYRKARPGAHKSRIKWFSIAFAGPFIASLDFLPKYGFSVYPIGYLGAVAWLIFVERAIWRYQLVDITPAFAADQIIRTVADPLLVLDEEGFIQVANEAACRLFGRSEAELVDTSIANLSPEFLPGEKLDQLIGTSGTLTYEIGYAFPGKEPVALDISASTKLDRTGRVVGIVCVARDITERRRAEDAVRASEERFHAVAQSANDAIISADNRGQIVFWNNGARAVFGYSAEEVVGRPLTMLMPERFRAAHQKGLERMQMTGDARVIGKTVELSGLRKDGREFPLELSLSMWKTRGDTFYSGIIRDITERKQAEVRLEQAAYYDFLTGLPNRRLFIELLGQALARARRSGKPTALMFLDLDNFKLINDTLGHAEGDAVLQTIAERLKSCVRATDAVARLDSEDPAGRQARPATADGEGNVVARLGGDEFTFLLEDIRSPKDLDRIATRILEAVARPCVQKEQEFVLSGSIGIVLYPTDGADSESLIKNADVAMYAAKRQKNTFRYYAPEMNARAGERLKLEAELRRGLEAGELLLHYQPFIDVHTGRISGVEALVRWQHPERGLLGPGTFIPLAEDTGLIVPLSQWVLRAACRQTKVWQAGGSPLRVAVNISRSLCQYHNLIEVIGPILDDTGLGAAALELELTESLLIQDRERTVAMLRDLHRIGMRISIDDFGVEYSSLSYLKQLPITTLKIDQSFVREVTTNGSDAAIAQAIVTLARCLNLTVIAEGVETAAQAAFLCAQRCDELQGYYFYRPMAADFITSLLQKNPIHNVRQARTALRSA